MIWRLSKIWSICGIAVIVVMSQAQNVSDRLMGAASTASTSLITPAPSHPGSMGPVSRKSVAGLIVGNISRLAQLICSRPARFRVSTAPTVT